MIEPARVRELLGRHGSLRPQAAEEWQGPFPLPEPLRHFYVEVGPTGINIEAYGNPFYLPSLAKLWDYQAGYRWNGNTGERLDDWDDDWLVFADQGADPFILSRTTDEVLFAQHGTDSWDPGELAPDVFTLVGCLAQLGCIVLDAGEQFTDEDSRIAPWYRALAERELAKLLGTREKADSMLASLGWG